MRRAIFAVFLLLPIASASAGQLYTLTQVGGQVAVATVDPVTGIVVPVIVTSATSFSNNAATVDTFGGRIFFKSGTQLFIVDTRSSSVTSLAVGTCCALLAFNASSQQLYGLDASGPNVILRTIDLQTGATPIALVTGASSVSLVQPALDPISRRLFFRDGVQAALYRVDLQTLTATSVPLAGCCAAFQFDPAAGALYGLDSSGSQAVLVRIDPATGATTPLIATGSPGVTVVPVGFDPIGRSLFFGNSIQGRIYTIAIPNGTRFVDTRFRLLRPAVFCNRRVCRADREQRSPADAGGGSRRRCLLASRDLTRIAAPTQRHPGHLRARDSLRASLEIVQVERVGGERSGRIVASKPRSVPITPYTTVLRNR